MAGGVSLKESVTKIFEPLETNYTIYTIVIVVVAIFTKIFLGQFFKKKGKVLNSESLVVSGTDALMDAFLSFSALIGIITSMIWKLNIEGYLGVIISIMIIKSSIDIFKETIDIIIGARPDPELTKNLKEKINSFEGVRGTYDLMLHSYGAQNMIGSCHIEVADSLTAKDIHLLTRTISEKIYKEFGIVLTIGIYASNDSGNAGKIRKDLESIISEYKDVLQLHGFYVDEEEKRISFDIIIDFNVLDPEIVKNNILTKIKEKYPQYEYNIVIDSDVSD